MGYYKPKTILQIYSIKNYFNVFQIKKDIASIGFSPIKIVTLRKKINLIHFLIMPFFAWPRICLRFFAFVWLFFCLKISVNIMSEYFHISSFRQVYFIASVAPLIYSFWIQYLISHFLIVYIWNKIQYCMLFYFFVNMFQSRFCYLSNWMELSSLST